MFREIEFVRIDGGPKETEYDPNPRPIPATLDQLAQLKAASAQSVPQRRSKSPQVDISSGDKSRIVARYRDGESIADLAVAFTTTGQRIRDILNVASANIRPANDKSAAGPESISRSDDMTLTTKDIDRMLEAHRAGTGVDEIARQFKTDRAAVEYHLARRGRVMKATPQGAPPATVTDPEHPAHAPVVSVMRQFGFTEGEIAEEMTKADAAAPRDTVGQVAETGGEPTETAAPRDTAKTSPARRDNVTEEMIRSIHRRYMAGESIKSLEEGGLPMSWAGITFRFRSMRLPYPRPRDKGKLVPANNATRAIPPKRDDVTDEMVRRWTVAVKLLGDSVAAISQETGFSVGLIRGRISTYLKRHPNVIRDAINEDGRRARGQTGGGPEQMDDPEVAAAVPPTPDEVLTNDTHRSRARALHASAGDSRVIAVQELPSVLARKPYMAPRILESGSILNVDNPHAAAKLVENLVAELNRVPGVQAYFEWRAEGQMGQPIAR